jgi:iron complex transport system ATP-binding protein
MTLVATGLGYRVGGQSLLAEVSLTLQPGRLLAVLGPNGAGKSTLLRLLSGERPVREGSLELEGRPLERWPRDVLAQRRAVVAQQDHLNFAFTAEEVVGLGRLPHPAGGGGARIVEAALQRVDALHLRTRRYPTLSGGERARVQLARALAQIWDAPAEGGRYLLLDEPTASQDLAHQHQCLQVARRMAREGVGVLVVLHDPNLVLDHADDVLVLRGGRTMALGTPREVLSESLLSQTYGIPVQIAEDERTGRRWIQVAIST